MNGQVRVETATSRVEGQGKLSETLGASYMAVCASSPLSAVYSLSVASFFLQLYWNTVDYNAVLVSGIQQSESFIPCRSLQGTE